MKNKEISAVEFFLRLLFPPRCICCDKLLSIKIQRALCGDCGDNLPMLARHTFTNPAGDSTGKIISAFNYEEGIRKAIHDMKFNDRPGNAAVLVGLSFPILGRYLCNADDSDIRTSNYDMLIPVPIHFKRMQRRGYNQSELIAGRLSKQINIPVYHRVLIKRVNTAPQSSLARGERLKNLKEAFTVRSRELIQGRRVLLVDDVMTTGSTLEQCAKVLIEAGALQVDAFVIAIRTKYVQDKNLIQE